MTETEEFLLLILQYKTKTFLANICAPNDQNFQVDFYTQLTRKLRSYVNSNLVPGGYFNCSLENIDKKMEKISAAGKMSFRAYLK